MFRSWCIDAAVSWSEEAEDEEEGYGDGDGFVENDEVDGEADYA